MDQHDSTQREPSPNQHPVAIVKEAFRKSRTEHSRGSDGSSVRSSTSERPCDQITTNERSCDQRPSLGSEESVEEDQERMDDGRLLDLSRRESRGVADFVSCSRPDVQFVVLQDEDEEEDNGGNHEQLDESLDVSDESAVHGSGGDESSFYKCSMCDKIFYHKQRLMMHLKKHMGAKPFACPLCPANFNTMASLQRHRRSHKTSSANITIHTCNQCHAQFSNIQHLTEHMKIHTEKRSCLHCGIFVGGMRSLQKHIATEHPYIGAPAKKYRTADGLGRGMLHTGNKKYLNMTGNKPVMCRQCGRQFQTTSALHGHMKGHSKLYQWKPRRCRCGVLLADEAEYRRHMKNSRCSIELAQEMGSPPVLSPVSTSQAAEFSPSAQTSSHSGSFDSGWKSPLYAMPNVPVSSPMAVTRMGTDARVLHPSLVNIRNMESGSFLHHRDVDNDSSVSKDTVSSVTMSEQSSDSPVGRVTIKTEEWTVVDAHEVASNATSDEHSARDLDDQPKTSREHPGTMISPFPLQLRAQQDIHQLQVENPVTSESNAPAFERQVSQAEAASSSQTFERGEPSRMRSGPYQRSSSESPGMQISSSQSMHPVSPNPLIDPTSLPRQPLDGTPWRCSYCGVSFEDSLMYVIHKGCHEPSSPFKCSMCGEQCSDKVTFMLHFVRGEHKKPTHV